MPFDDPYGAGYPNPPDQYLRKWTLSLSGSGLPGANPATVVVLTTNETGHDLRMSFQVRQADSHTPNTAVIRVYNLQDSTVANVIAEFNRVELQAGYVSGKYSTIFSGTIKQYKRGRESAVDTYLDIYAADGDLATNCATVNKTLAAETAYRDRHTALEQAYKAAQPGLESGAPSAYADATLGGTLPRDRVLYGMAIDETRDLTRSTRTRWSIQNGRTQTYGETEAPPANEVTILTAQSGLIGMPEATQDGIELQCLLNPTLRPGSLVKLDNSAINQYFQPGGLPAQGVQWPSYNSTLQFYAATGRDGLYRVYVIDYEGDTRGIAWYNRMVCLAVDPSADLGAAVQAASTAPASQCAASGG